MAMPLGTTVGSSNAVMFGVALMNFRDADLNVHVDRMPAAMTNHDMDAPRGGTSQGSRTSISMALRRKAIVVSCSSCW